MAIIPPPRRTPRSGAGAKHDHKSGLAFALSLRSAHHEDYLIVLQASPKGKQLVSYSYMCILDVQDLEALDYLDVGSITNEALTMKIIS